MNTEEMAAVCGEDMARGYRRDGRPARSTHRGHAVTAITDVTEPGVYHGIPDAVYLADPVPGGSLSSTGARAILPPGCPALYRWQALNGRPDTAAFDLGKAAHAEVLGAGAPIVVVYADDWRTKAAKEAAEQARAEGATPLLAKDHAVVQAMAAALRAHPLAAALLGAERGQPEVSLFWRDARADVMCRARLDWLPNPLYGRMVIPDYKTAPTADPGAFARSTGTYGYHQQAAFYLNGAAELGLAEDFAFLFIVQAKTPPYLVSVCELDATALRIGRARNREAIDLYAHCKTTDTWPGYDEDVTLVALPAWAEREANA